MYEDPRERDMSGVVRHCALKAYHKIKGTISLDDLIDAGHVGLNYASKYFKVGRGCQWNSFSTMVINQRIYKYITDSNRKKMHYDHYPIIESNRTNSPLEKKLVDKLATYDNVDEFPNKEYLNWLIENSGLTYRYQNIMTMLSMGIARKDVAKYKGVSQERIRQIYNKSIQLMKDTHFKETLKVGA